MVSTEEDEQATSYKAQVDYYTSYIKSRAGWQFVKVYTDEGITGTSIRKRNGFKSMVANALSGKIDLIVTKSVSRFARNTVDSLTTIRQLKEKNIEVYFEKENIRTFDGKGELLITIMSSLAQEEARSISENCTWGQRKRFADGKASLAYSRFLGYDRAEDGGFALNEKEAVIVRRIYALFLSGMCMNRIARTLTAEGHTPPGNGVKWRPNNIRSILTNEKYIVDALLQKTFTEDFLTKKHRKNNGEIPQYYVKGNHEAIVPRDVFETVQCKMRGIDPKKGIANIHPFSGKMWCSECGDVFGSKVWHSTDKYRKTVWRCNGKYKYGKTCSNRHITEDELKETYINALNTLLENEIDETWKVVREKALDTSALEAKVRELNDKLDEICNKVELEIKANSTITQDQKEYQRRYDALCFKFEKTRSELKEVQGEIDDRKSRMTEAEVFFKNLAEIKRPVAELDERTFNILVKRIVVSKDKIEVVWDDGNIN